MLKDFTLKYLLLLTPVFIALIVTGYYIDFHFAIIIPLLLIIAYLAIFKLETLFWLIVFCTPLSVVFEKLDLAGIGFYFPTEPLLFILLLILFLKQLFRKTTIEIWNHPLSLSFVFYFIWLFFTSITSEIPLVSFKFLLSKLWLIVPVFFFGLLLFKRITNIKKFIWLYLISLSLVIAYTIIRHAVFGFSEEAGHWVMSPFFKDHTSYGAIIALMLPVLVAFFQLSEKETTTRFLLLLLILVYLLGLYYSYTRAAWLTVIGGVGVWALIKYKFKLKYLLSIIGLLTIYLFMNFIDLSYGLQKNKSEHTTENLSERIESMSNISTDASNLERINRWTSAIRMFEERPIVGFGPGTFAFEYAPFQDPDKLSIISTNFGNMGNTHSEYLGPLAETGLIGMLSVLLIVFVIFYKSIKLYYKIEDHQLKTIVLSLIVGLSTYFAHGVLNNYLDTDKASIPVWGFCAIIMAIELYHKDKLKKTTA